MSLLWMIIVGLIVGAIAKLLMPGHDPGGLVVTMLLGVGGSLLAGSVGEFDSVAPDVSRSRVFDLGRQSAGSDRQVGANSCVEELTLAEVPGAIHVV